MVCQRGVQPRLSHSLNRRLYTLKHTDYLLANYQNPAGDQINLYISYYESQRKGKRCTHRSRVSPDRVG
jgi:hypothetical protein